LVVLAGAAGAETRYVDLNNFTPAAPYTSWSTAATNIQDAVDVAVAGDEIVVTNGVYQTGAREVYGMSNRVAVTKPVAVRSVNGPAVTQILGYQVPGTTNGPAAVRCLYLTDGAVLAGFTLAHGATRTSGDPFTNRAGGGVWCEGLSAVVSNCVITGNSADFGGGAYDGTLNDCTLTVNSADDGGGAYYGTLNNCTLTGNSARSTGGGAYDGTLSNCTLTSNSAHSAGGAFNSTLDNCTVSGNAANSGAGVYYGTLNNCTVSGNSANAGGGGAYSGTLNNCTLTGNSASFGGGAYSGTLNNCIVHYNSARYDGTNYYDATVNYCCTTPLPPGTGNLAEEPQLASGSHLSAGSPCLGRGSAAYAQGVDVDREPWANPPSIGCDEYWSGSVTGALGVSMVVAYTNVAAGFGVDFQAVIGGRVSASRWDFGDGSVVSNRPWASHAWAAAGDYVVELRAYNESHPAGVATTVTMRVRDQAIHYVALNSSNPVPPYGSWATAATNIQDAVDAATLPGALVWVSNGVYQTGARAVYGMSNRVAVTKPVTLRSVNGAAVTQIMGYKEPRTTNGPTAVRCVYLTNGAVLAGFTLTNGATQTSSDYYRNQSGGGLWSEGLTAVVSNCVLTGNSAYSEGGGACSSTLNNCTLTGNSASGAGGARGGTLNSCTLTGNSATVGGGVFGGTLNNCTLTGNSAYSGGAANSSRLNNCTLTGNAASTGGGTSYGTVNNCIVYYNTAASGANYYRGTLDYCCTTPRPAGTGNLTNAPSLVNTNGWSNLRLRTNSSCINRGNNASAPGPTDFDGRPRIVGGNLDIGAYEFQGPGMGEFIGWLWQYGLPTDGSADATDPDQDRLNNSQEWVAGTNPTNAASVLRMLPPTASGPDVTLTWSSVETRAYALERATNLGVVPAFSLLQSNIAGLPGTTRWADTNASESAPRFYRVRVEQ
jgi:hypothetical protein